jgi:hypothetical protein
MYINEDAALIVNAPFNASEEIINKVVLKYMDRLLNNRNNRDRHLLI